MSVLSPQFGNLVPTPKLETLASNYLNFADGGGNDFAQQYLPEIYEAEVERYGNRTIGGFLRMVGAEMPMMSDQVVWYEQNRLHISYDNVTCGNGGTANTLTIQGLGASIVNVVFPNQTIVIMDPADPSFTCKAMVLTSGATANPATGVLTVQPYTRTNVNAGAANRTGLKIFVYGSEFAKGVSGPGASQSIEPQLSVFSNKPIIIRDRYAVSGSDTAQIGWVETIDESGQTGYSWYMKSASETRLRFEDYVEMTMIEAVKGVPGSSTADSSTGMEAGENFGSEGLFEAIETRGNVFEDLASLADFDLVLKNLDKQGAIEENMLYVNRDLALTFDDMMAGLNSNYQGGASFGVFENSADMALNLGFSGLRRGSYDFYKSDWRYLNDATGRGGFGDVSGVLIPAGVSSVYDEGLGRNIKRPFLHVRYRASQTDDRRMKSWVTGSVGGASYIGDDYMEVHYLSERCLVVQAANNFILLKES